jgi:hypothetical protein
MADDKGEQTDPGFRIVDKRKPAADERKAEDAAQGKPPLERGAPADRGAPSAAAGAEAQAEAGGAAGEEQVPLEPVDVYGVVQYCISLLSGHAWQTMGLVMNPVTRKVERDLQQARIAIDCIEALYRQIEPGIAEGDARQFRQVLNDLRMNFVRQGSQEG